MPTTHRKVPRGNRLDPTRPPLSEEEIEQSRSDRQAFANRCRLIFDRVYPTLIKDYRDWFIYIEPDSGDYEIDSVEEICFQQIRHKHPTDRIMAMRLNKTGTCGRI